MRTHALPLPSHILSLETRALTARALPPPRPSPTIPRADANNADIVRVLLNGGANPKTQDQKAGTALSRARDKHHTLVAQLLEQAILKAGGGGGGGGEAGSPDKDKPRSASGSEGGARKKNNPLAKGALGSQVADVFTSGRGSSLEKDTKERTKGVTYKAVSLDAALNSNPGSKK